MKYEKLFEGVLPLRYADCSLLEFGKAIKDCFQKEKRKDFPDRNLRNALEAAACIGWELLLSRSTVEYENDDGWSFAVLWRDSEQSQTDVCPFCSKRHFHGVGDGHRSAHCEKVWQKNGEKIKSEVSAEDGTVLKQQDGYIIKTRRY